MLTVLSLRQRCMRVRRCITRYLVIDRYDLNVSCFDYCAFCTDVDVIFTHPISRDIFLHQTLRYCSSPQPHAVFVQVKDALEKLQRRR